MIMTYESKIRSREQIKGIFMCNCGGVINPEKLKTRKDEYYFGKCTKCNQEYFAGSFEDLTTKIKNYLLNKQQ